MKVILIFSGGIDSTTLLYFLLNIGFDVSALAFDYGQRHKKELKCAENICKLLNVPLQIIDLGAIKSLLKGSSQTDFTTDVPEGHFTDEIMKTTVVPNRNMIMLSLAFAKAISEKITNVAYGAHAGDHTIYPDCRPNFVEAIKLIGQLCDWQTINLMTPFLNLTKKDIIKLGLNLQVPYELTWSCYKGKEKACGKCGTCVERKEAFKLNNVEDPLQYE